MSFIKIFKALNFSQLINLLGWFFRHPPFMIATVFATIQTFSIAQKYFPYIHGRHNTANAFRHALWNILIAKKCHKIAWNLSNVLAWTKNITDWHEEFSPNELMAKTMDLHNNKIGRDLYKSKTKESTLQYVNLLLDQVNEAVKIEEINEFDNHLNQLVYLED